MICTHPSNGGQQPIASDFNSTHDVISWNPCIFDVTQHTTEPRQPMRDDVEGARGMPSWAQGRYLGRIACRSDVLL